MQSVISKVKSFHRNEDGIATVWAIFWMIICFALSGLAIDTANAWKVKQILQSTADVSSLSAGMEFYFVDSDPDHPLIELVKESPLEKRVKIVANMYAEDNMHVARYGDVLPDESIFLGYWNGNTFTPDIAGDAIFPNAVHVITEQVDNHSLGTYFLRFISIFDFDIRASATVAFSLASCEGAAILSKGNVMIEGQNAFSYFCIYGEEGVDVQASNFFGEGTYVGMPDVLEQCGSGNSYKSHCTFDSMATSEGFAEAVFGHSDEPPDSLYYKTDAATGFFGGVDSLSGRISIYADEFEEYTKAVEVGDNATAEALKSSLVENAAYISGEFSSLTDDYLYESQYGTDSDDEANEITEPAYLNTNVVILDMAKFIDAEEEVIELNDDGTTTLVKASYSRSLFDVIDEIHSTPFLEEVNYYSSPTNENGDTILRSDAGYTVDNYGGTTYIVDCTRLDQDRNYKMDMGGSNLPRTLSGIAIIGIDCDYKFDTSISYDSAFIVTTSTAGLKGNGRASVSSSAGAYLGNKNQSCDFGKVTLLTQGSMKFGSKLRGSNFDFIVDGTVNISSGSNSDPEPHVGSSITAVNDVHISSHHTFNGCGGPYDMTAGDVGNSKFRVSLVQ